MLEITRRKNNEKKFHPRLRLLLLRFKNFSDCAAKINEFLILNSQPAAAKKKSSLIGFLIV